MSYHLEVEGPGGRSELELKALHTAAHKARIRRIAVDERGDPCQRAMLTHEGRILAAGSVALNYEDRAGDTVPRSELIATDHEGNPRRLQPTTLGKIQRLEGPVEAEAVLDYAIDRAFAVTGGFIQGELRLALGEGAIYQVPFRTRATSLPRISFLLANEESIFLIQGAPHGFGFLGPHERFPTREEDKDWIEDTWDESWEFEEEPWP